MFYKVIKDDKIIDVLEELVYLKYQSKHNRMQFCEKEDAQAIFSSDRSKIWHERSLYDIPVSGYDTVYVKEIDQYEYDRLKVLHCMTSEEIIDNIILDVIKSDFKLDIFTDALVRLYKDQVIDKDIVVELFNNKKITDNQKTYILNQ